MRLIDADALYERAYKLNLDYIVSDVELRTLKRLLSEEPTVEIANVAEVVRCKDCKFYSPNNGGECTRCGGLEYLITADEYCSKGE